jgi:squalene cyclase
MAKLHNVGRNKPAASNGRRAQIRRVGVRYSMHYGEWGLHVLGVTLGLRWLALAAVG